MKRIFLLFLLLGIIGSCTQSEKKKEGLLSEDQMVAILLDVQLTEGMVNTFPVPYDSSQVLYSLLEKEIFIKHGVSDSVFTANMKIYLEDALAMERIYARIIDSLVVKENNPGLEERM